MEVRQSTIDLGNQVAAYLMDVMKIFAVSELSDDSELSMKTASSGAQANCQPE